MVGIEGTDLVPADSPLRTIEDVDREGVRIAVARNAAYDLFLTRTLKHAQIVHAPSPSAALDVFVNERLDTVAGVRQPLLAAAKANPNLAYHPRPVHGDQASDGNAKGPRGRRAVLASFRRGNEGVWLCRRRSPAERSGCDDRAALGRLAGRVSRLSGVEIGPAFEVQGESRSEVLRENDEFDVVDLDAFGAQPLPDCA